MLKSFPLDTERIRFVAIDVEAVPDYAADGSRNGRQRTDAEGRLLYRVNALAIVEGETGGETVQVRVAFDDEPTIVPLSPVRFSGLQARPWEQGDRHGIALVADGVEAEHSSNGRAKRSDPLSSTEPAAA